MTEQTDVNAAIITSNAMLVVAKINAAVKCLELMDNWAGMEDAAGDLYHNSIDFLNGQLGEKPYVSKDDRSS